jgi:hypothetical protein
MASGCRAVMANGIRSDGSAQQIFWVSLFPTNFARLTGQSPAKLNLPELYSGLILKLLNNIKYRIFAVTVFPNKRRRLI